MPAIMPNSRVLICKGVPLDSSYKHTLYFQNLSTQFSIIQGYKKYTLTDQSYQRVSRGTIRVQYVADLLQDCNYIMFQNTNYLYSDGTAKWFYAFIKQINYINDSVSEIEYEIDVMQTYYFNYTVGACFVEREHSLTDLIFESQTDEGFDPGEMVVRGTTVHSFDPSNANFAPNYYAVIYYIPSEKYFQEKVYTRDATLSPADVSALSMYNCYNHMPMPSFTLSIPIETSDSAVTTFTVTALKYATRTLTEIGASIVSIQMIPTPIASAVGLLSGTNDTNNFNQQPYTTSISRSMGTSFKNVSDSLYYIPKNKKLSQFPYTYVTVDAGNGSKSIYKWELFYHPTGSAPVATFRIKGVVNPDVELSCSPANYQAITLGLSNDQLGVSFSDFPTLAWSADSYAEWWAANKNSASLAMITKVIGTTAAGAAGIATGNPVLASAAASGVGTIAQSLASMQDSKNSPDMQRGSATGSGMLLAQNRLGFTIRDMSICGERAKIIDDFFSMYGYAVKSVKTLNIRTAAATALRPQWNYIQTSNVTIRSNNMNAEAMQKIEGIYNKGITFWMHASNVGDYSLNNAPV